MKNKLRFTGTKSILAEETVGESKHRLSDSKTILAGGLKTKQ